MPTFDFQVFYLAALAWRLGANPYAVHGFYNPIWALIPFLPLTLLPIDLARQVWIVVTLLVTLVALWRLGVHGVKLWTVLLCSPWLWSMLIFSNVDCLVLLGATLTPVIGIWLLLLKPQLTFVLIGWWIVRFIQQRDTGRLNLLLASLGLAFAAQGLAGGWPRPNLPEMATWSMDLFPWGIPLGLLLGWIAWQQRESRAALAASPFLSPYVGVGSWIVTTPWFAQRWQRLVIWLLASWLLVYCWHGGFL